MSALPTLAKRATTGRIHPLVQRKSGASRNGAPFADLSVALLRLEQGLLSQIGGDGVMPQVLVSVPPASRVAVLVAVELVAKFGVLSTEHVEKVLARLDVSPTPASVESSLHRAEAQVANTSRYDSLRVTGVDLACTLDVRAG